MADPAVSRKRPREGDFEREGDNRRKGGPHGGKGSKGGKRGGGKGGKKGGGGGGNAGRRTRVIVNRLTTTPFVVRAWVRQGQHVDVDGFAEGGVPTGDVAVHCWEDTTLREVADLLAADASVDLGEPDSVLHFALVSRLASGAARLRDVGAPVSRSIFRKTDDTVLSKAMSLAGDHLAVKVVKAPVAKARAALAQTPQKPTSSAPATPASQPAVPPVDDDEKVDETEDVKDDDDKSAAEEQSQDDEPKDVAADDNDDSGGK